MSDFVVDGLGMVHSRANWDALQKMMSPAWRRVLGVAKPFDPATAFRVSRTTPYGGDHALDRWADDGGAL